MSALTNPYLGTFLSNTLAAKKQMLQGEDISPNISIRQEVATSWKRSMDLGISYNSVNLQKLNQAELIEKCTKNQMLFDLGSRIIDSVNQTLNYIQCSISLTDKQGYILYTNSKINKGNFQSAQGLGRCFKEEVVGTNSISLALYLDRDVTIIGPEHYCSEFENNCCSTGVIKNTHQETIGTITVTHHIDSFSEFPQGLAVTISRMIEWEIQTMHYVNLIDSTLNATNELVVFLDKNLRIEKASQAFLKLVDMSAQDVSKLDIKEIFRDIDFDELICNGNDYSGEKELCLYIFGKELRMRASMFIIRNGNEFDSLAIFCRDHKTILPISESKAKLGVQPVSRGNAGVQKQAYSFAKIVTHDPQMKSIIRDCKRIADQDVPVLFEGESGVGKELFAQLIYTESKRRNGPFIAVNCAALPTNLIESELFGYEKGAFTGGLACGKAGKFEMADGGVIFLDEIGELCLDVQAKLLRVLDNNKYVRISGGAERSLDIKVIAATNRDLREEVKKNNFRADLYYRLNVMNFRIPTLNERPGDILLLTQHFLAQLNQNNVLDREKKVSREVEAILTNYHWEGNVRELQNVLIRAFYLCQSEEITSEHLPAHIRNYTGVPPCPRKFMQAQDDAEYRIIYDALLAAHGKVSKASENINMPVSTLYRKISQYQINLKEMY